MRGRKTKPTHLKVVAGNPGRRPLNTREPKPRGKLVDPPAWMNTDQREAWQYAIDHAPAGLLFKLDRSILAVWVVAECIHREATEKLQASGLLVKTKNGQPMQSPFLPIVNRQAVVMLRAAEQLGFSPSARARVELHEPQEEDETEKFFPGAG